MHLFINLIIGIVVGAGVTSGVLFIRNGRRKQAVFEKKWNELQEEEKKK